MTDMRDAIAESLFLSSQGWSEWPTLEEITEAVYRAFQESDVGDDDHCPNPTWCEDCGALWEYHVTCGECGMCSCVCDPPIATVTSTDETP